MTRHRHIATTWFTLAALAAVGPGCGGCDGATGGEGEGERTGEGEGEQDPDAPQVDITAPADGAQFSRGQSISFVCTAQDPQDGAVPNADIRWSSSVDGDIGIGATIQTALVTPGPHAIVCRATDADGLVGSDTIGITIVDNFAPEVTIEAPLDGAFFSQDQTITFRGAATDAEDGALLGVALVWGDNGSPLGAGAVVSTALPLGDHTITLTATDAEGAEGVAQIVVHVVDNLPPVCTIDNPSDGDEIADGATVSFRSTCDDPDGGVIDNASVTWSSSVQGALGVGFDVTTALVVAGVHTITVCAEDPADPAVEGCASIDVTVFAPPVVVITAPADGAALDSDTAVTFTGTADDVEDGALVPTWRDSIVGDFDTATTTQLTLLPGMHVITLSATDSDGFTATDTITVTATPGAAPFSTLFDTLALGTRVDDLTYDAASGTLWAATDGDGLHDVALDLSGSTAFDAAGSDLPNDAVNAVAVASDGTLLVATDGGLGVGCAAATVTGCSVLGDGALNGNLESDLITAVATLPDGRVVIGTDNCLTFVDFDAGESQRFCQGDGDGDGLAGDQIRDLAVTPSGAVLVVTSDGVSRMTPDGGVDASFSDVELGVDTARAVAVALSGMACFATDEGVVVTEGNGNGNRRRYDEDDGLPDNDVRDVAFDVITVNAAPRSVCWAATAGGLGRVDHDEETVVGITADDGLPSNDCRSIAVVPVSVKVVGTDAGLFSYAGF